MGLSSSQGRLLLLTSRISDIEFEEIMISQRQQQLAIDRENVAKEYNEAMSNHKIVIKLPSSNNDGTYTKENINYNNLCSAGYFLTNNDKQVYLKKKEDGSWDIPEGTANVISGPEQDENGVYKIRIGKDETDSAVYEVIDGTELLNKPDAISKSIVNGALYVLNSNDGLAGISMDNLNADTNMEYVLDTSDDAQAQSKYEYELSKISRQDNMLDMELQQLETQHEALLKEYESIRKVISNNIDRTFDMFSNG